MKSCKIIYQQVFKLSSSADTTLGTLSINSGNSLYEYGMSKPSKTILINYVDIDGQSRQGFKAASAGDSIGKCVYKKNSDRSMISREKIVDQYFIVHDTLNRIHWTITQDQKVIKNYKVTKAIGVFHARTYLAWFTTLIPFQDGPWKLTGLPGLILEAQDESGEVYFNALNIQANPNISRLITAPSGYIEIANYDAFLLKQKELESLDIEKGKSYFKKSGGQKKISVRFKITNLDN